MSRLSIPTPETSPAGSLPLLAAVQQKIGMVPNLMKLLGNSPAALSGYLSLSGAIEGGQLSGADRERIALAVAEANGCEYCLAAHSFIGKNVAKLSEAEIDAARGASSGDARSKAILVLARAIVDTQGRVSDQHVENAHSAGISDAEIVEIVVNVALNTMTNYVNNVARTEVDFPAAASRQAA